MRNNEPDGLTAADTTRGRKPVGRTARGQASGLCATQRRGAARASAWPTSGARLDAPSRSRSASIDPRWAGGPFGAASPCSPRRRSWRSTTRHRLGQANALAAPRRCVAQRPEACPLAVRPTGSLLHITQEGRRTSAARKRRGGEDDGCVSLTTEGVAARAVEKRSESIYSIRNRVFTRVTVRGSRATSARFALCAPCARASPFTGSVARA